MHTDIYHTNSHCKYGHFQVYKPHLMEHCYILFHLLGILVILLGQLSNIHKKVGEHNRSITIALRLCIRHNSSDIEVHKVNSFISNESPKQRKIENTQFLYSSYLKELSSCNRAGSELRYVGEISTVVLIQNLIPRVKRHSPYFIDILLCSRFYNFST